MLMGMGVLVVRGGAGGLRPLMKGGAQEHGLRPGTTSPALAAATALAVELAEAGGMTLVGFLRDSKMNVYAGAERVIGK